MNWLLTAGFCAVLVELFLRLPFRSPLKALRWSSERAARVVMAKGVSDHWKEKAMSAYARRTFVSSMKIAGLVAVVLGAATLLMLTLDRLFNGFQAFILSWAGLGSGVVGASLYAVVRKAVIRV